MGEFQGRTIPELRIAQSADGVVTMTLDRPEKKNAVTLAMWRQIAATVDALNKDETARVIVLCGAGTDFCAGADIGEFAELRRDAGTARAYEDANSAAFAALRACRLPVIASISGVCFGGGFGLAAACDIRLGATGAVFAVPAARLGLAYPADAMADIVAACGPQMARYLSFSGARLPAEAAHEAGFLLELLTDKAALDDRTNEIARAIAGNAPLSVGASKASIRAALSGRDDDLARARTLGDATFDSADYAEGRAAFLERRPPRFIGR
ncbi:enoyl-CoA hydratase [Nitratireductor sp. CAU 1489]|uniref:Enoyl-CoA hydratase n=1 Tax=Nitratireductor arenosus TaxID=2682096 RepID=A0A844QIF2_9HYPH|nr:enoyl-CoA hydratase-related protein [Nitratireductor arenosus]MVA99075.1 enoyl-CoA hydratase [Nitratireductor arenosus]